VRSLMWFRNDLRTRDNPALRAACRGADAGVVAVFLTSPKQWREHDWGAPKVDFVWRNVCALSDALEALHIPLKVVRADRFDDAPGALARLAKQLKCGRLCFNVEHEVHERRRDERVKRRFEEDGLEVIATCDQTAVRPDDIETGEGRFYTVFTPFKKAWLRHVDDHGLPKASPRPGPRPGGGAARDDLPERFKDFVPAESLEQRWPAGEDEAARRLRRFLRRRVDDYADHRDRCDLEGTSTLSPYLACGVISIRTCLNAAQRANGGRLDGGKKGLDTWISELIWREFYRHVLVGFPRVSMNRAFKTETEKLKWRDSPEDFDAWCAGRTGYPIVDAAMRCLRATGWMHNRLRMIVAMFLTKDLWIDWRRGESHFMQHLVDGDLASNNGGWQWSASTGTDAVPHFRIFNPISQSQKCDPDGAFIRRWVSELEEVDGADVHEPPDALRESTGYPRPIVDHAEARRRALAAFKKLK